MLNYLLFAFYLCLLGIIILKNSFIRSTGFSNTTILFLFLLKIAAGLSIGWISANYYPQGNDYWTLNHEGLLEHDLLRKDPARFFTNIFDSPYANKYAGFFDSVGSYWNDLKNNIIIKILALLDFLSGGNYYINSLLLNSFSFFGHVALAKVFLEVSNKNKAAVISGCFLLPTTLYFSSGIHKDLVVFTMLGFFTYALFFSLRDGFSVKRWLLLAASTVFLLFMRNFVVLALIAPVIHLYLHFKKNIQAPFSLFLALSILVCVAAGMHFTPADPLKLIVQKQKDFADLEPANTQLSMNELEPTVLSFALATPRAINHSFFRPYFWEYPGHFLMIPAIELFLILILLGLAFFKKRPGTMNPAIALFSITFSILAIWMAGYIVPNLGSLVRYRSLYLPFLVTPLLAKFFSAHFLQRNS